MQYVTFTGDKLVRNDSARVFGWSISNNTGTAIVVHVHDSIDGSGPIVMRVNVAPNDSKTFSSLPIPFDTGVFVDLATGTSCIGTILVD
jgi:hypothetical protein